MNHEQQERQQQQYLISFIPKWAEWNLITICLRVCDCISFCVEFAFHFFPSIISSITCSWIASQRSFSSTCNARGFFPVLTLMSLFQCKHFSPLIIFKKNWNFIWTFFRSFRLSFFIQKLFSFQWNSVHFRNNNRRNEFIACMHCSSRLNEIINSAKWKFIKWELSKQKACLCVCFLLLSNGMRKSDRRPCAGKWTCIWTKTDHNKSIGRQYFTFPFVEAEKFTWILLFVFMKINHWKTNLFLVEHENIDSDIDFVVEISFRYKRLHMFIVHAHFEIKKNIAFGSLFFFHNIVWLLFLQLIWNSEMRSNFNELELNSTNELNVRNTLCVFHHFIFFIFSFVFLSQNRTEITEKSWNNVLWNPKRKKKKKNILIENRFELLFVKSRMEIMRENFSLQFSF